MNGAEAALARRLRNMQWLATGLLAAMAVIFVLTSLWRDEYPVLNYVWAFAEAALIGGLADWFAVTALFRRPLGLPIPHTAIVPNRKDEIGTALANFIADNFMVRSALEVRLRELDLARAFGRWLAQPDNANSLARDLSRALRWLLEGKDKGPLREAVKSGLRDLGRSLPVRDLVAAVIDVFASGPHAQQLLDHVVAYGREQLDRNKLMIRARIHEKSPWWLPRFVDEEIFDQIVGEMERILNDVGTDPNHPARKALDARLEELKTAVVEDGRLIGEGVALREAFLEHPAIADFTRDVAMRAQDYVRTALADPDSDLSQGFERELRAIGRALSEDSPVTAQLDDWLREVTIYLVETYRQPISAIVSTTIAAWDPSATSRRIELQIGRDLQFIRINGTLVGGLVGLLLYLSWTATLG
jgi:uncharacterized membrane-anchored protein YjiN (DUF445 family)